MKISPLSQGSGVPSAEVGAASTQRSSPDRIAAAKAIMNGEEPMRITRTEHPDPQVERIQQNIRKIKLRTQVSTDRDYPPLDELDVAPASDSAIIENNEQAPATSEETKPLSPQFAALAKQRRALQQERAALDKEKAELAALPKDGSAVDWKAELKQDPLRMLEEAGVSYDQLTEAILNGQQNPAMSEIRALKAEIEALKTGVDTKLSDRDAQTEQQVLAEMSREANNLVARGDYKYTEAMGKQKYAVDLIHKTWKSSGEILDVSEALELIEAECKKDYERLSAKLTPAQESQLQQQQQTQSQGMRTLTNRDGARPTLTPRQRALAAFYGTLKR